jgi:hypothetical protein
MPVFNTEAANRTKRAIRVVDTAVLNLEGGAVFNSTFGHGHVLNMDRIPGDT